MARTIIALCAVALLSGCQALGQRLNVAATTQGQANAEVILPEMPESCTAHIERVYPKVGEKARWTVKRWEIVAESRDQLADDCREWWDDYRASVAQITG
tara:strand:+ start:2810 stop:3109 length:300 start_codon:yes stop_codon:yes gene_type:complete